MSTWTWTHFLFLYCALFHFNFFLVRSTDSGWENPFRPGGDLSREADEIVELIKGGKPITPTPGSQAPTLPTVDEVDVRNSIPNNKSPITESPKKANKLGATPQKNAKNGNLQNDKTGSPGAVEVQRGTVIQGDASQVEHIVLKKKPKCKCCVIQ